MFMADALWVGAMVHSISRRTERTRWRGMKIDMTDEQLETVINKAYNEGYKRGYQDGVQHIKNVVKGLDEVEE